MVRFRGGAETEEETSNKLLISRLLLPVSRADLTRLEANYNVDIAEYGFVPIGYFTHYAIHYYLETHIKSSCANIPTTLLL